MSARMARAIRGTGKMPLKRLSGMQGRDWIVVSKNGAAPQVLLYLSAGTVYGVMLVPHLSGSRVAGYPNGFAKWVDQALR